MNSDTNNKEIIMKFDTDPDEIAARIKETEVYLDKIRGSLIGGAAGDALGYAIEFYHEAEIFQQYGKNGITEYELDHHSKKALISDDTQMTLFTANGILVGATRAALRGIVSEPSFYVQKSYLDWLRTQEMSYSKYQSKKVELKQKVFSWLNDVPELYSRRAPGNTCLSALSAQKKIEIDPEKCLKDRMNKSKGCGGVMRVAPMGLKSFESRSQEWIDREGAVLAAITHGHSLGFMPAAVLVHIIYRIVYRNVNPDTGEKLTLLEIIEDARDTVCRIFENDKHVEELEDIINHAIQLSTNQLDDLDNIHALGEGWVAEETLAIAIYCSLKYQNDFSAGIIAAVNHKGDSDSTGAVTGNILGALLGYEAIEDKWKENLELHDVILEVADDLCHGCQMGEYSSYDDPDWTRKYINMTRFLWEDRC